MRFLLGPSRDHSSLVTARAWFSPLVLVASLAAGGVSDGFGQGPIFGNRSAMQPERPSAPAIANLLESSESLLDDGQYDEAFASIEEILRSPTDGFPTSDPLSRRSTGSEASIKSRAYALIRRLEGDAREAFIARNRARSSAVLARVEMGVAGRGEVERRAALDPISPSIVRAAILICRTLVDAGQFEEAKSLLARIETTAPEAKDLPAAITTIQSSARGGAELSFVPSARWTVRADALHSSLGNSAAEGSVAGEMTRYQQRQSYRVRSLRHFGNQVVVPPSTLDPRVRALSATTGDLNWSGGRVAPPSRSQPGVSADGVDSARRRQILQAREDWTAPTATVGIGKNLVVQLLRADESNPLGLLRGFDGRTGRLRWMRAPTTWPGVPTDARLVAPLLADRERDRVVALLRSGMQIDLIVIDAATGTITSSQMLTQLGLYTTATLDGLHRHGISYVRTGSILTAYDTIAKRIVWQTSWSSPYSPFRVQVNSGLASRNSDWGTDSMHLVDGQLVVTGDNRQLLAFDAATGALRWKREARNLKAIEAVSKQAIFGVGDNTVVAFDLETGTPIWSTTIADDFVGGPGLLDQQRLVLPLAAGDLLFLDADDGTQLARTPSGLSPPGGLTRIGDSVFLSHPTQVTRLASRSELETQIAAAQSTTDDDIVQQAARLRAIDFLQLGRPEAAIGELTSGTATLDRDATELLARTILTQLPEEWNSVRQHVGSIDPTMLDERLRRSWHLGLAAAYGSEGNTQVEFENQLAILTLPPITGLDTRDERWEVRPDRLLLGAVRRTWRQADRETRSRLEEAVKRLTDRLAASDDFAALRRLPAELQPTPHLRTILFGRDVDLSDQAENALRRPNAAGLSPEALQLNRPARPKALDWLISPKLTIGGSSVTPRPVPIPEQITSLRFGPPRMWVVDASRTIRCLDANGQPIGQLARRSTTNDWSGLPTSILRRGLTTYLVYENGVRVVGPVDRGSESDPSGLPIFPSRPLGPFDSGRGGFASNRSRFLCSPPTDGPLLITFGNSLAAIDVREQDWSFWWTRTNFESIVAVASDADFACIVNGPHVYALDANTGAIDVKRALPAPLWMESRSPSLRRAVSTSQAAVDHRFLLRDERSLFLYDPVTDVRNWSRTVEQTASIRRITTDEIIIAYADGRIERVELSSGRTTAATRVPRWEMQRGLSLQMDAWLNTSDVPGVVISLGVVSDNALGSRSPTDFRIVRLTDSPATTWSAEVESGYRPAPQPSLWPAVAVLRSVLPGSRPRLLDRRSTVELFSVSNGQVVASESRLPGSSTLYWDVPSSTEMQLYLERATISLVPR